MRFTTAAVAAAIVSAAAATPTGPEFWKWPIWGGYGGHKKPHPGKNFVCPAGGNLTKPYIKPSRLTEVSQKFPDAVLGATKYPLITAGDLCVIVNLDLPAVASTKVCQLQLDFPDHSQTDNYYFYNGPGNFTFTGYAIGVGAVDSTTYNNQPAPGPSPPAPPHIAPGNAYTIFRAPCSTPNKTTTVSGMLCSPDTTWNWFQSDKKCPIGFFVELQDTF